MIGAHTVPRRGSSKRLLRRVDIGGIGIGSDFSLGLPVAGPVDTASLSTIFSF